MGECACGFVGTSSREMKRGLLSQSIHFDYQGCVMRLDTGWQAQMTVWGSYGRWRRMF